MTKVSIIIPVFNVEKYIRQALDSVVNQTLKDIEIICIDDCSTDNSLNILNEYAQKDSRIKILTQPKNQGQGSGRNWGIDIAQGEYIMFLDPDDWYELTACEEAYNQIKQNDNEFVLFNFNRYIENKKKLKKVSYYLRPFEKVINEKQIKLYELEEPFLKSIYTVTGIYNKDYLNQYNIRFNSNLRMTEDGDFFINAIINSNSISLINKPLYTIRFNTSSTTATKYHLWKQFISARLSGYTLVRESTHSKEYLKSYIPYLINSNIFWLNKWLKDLDRNEAQEYYNEVKNIFINLNNEYDIDTLRPYIKYTDFKNILKFNFKEFNKNIFIEKLFSIKSEYKHTIINFLGIRLKIKGDFDE